MGLSLLLVRATPDSFSACSELTKAAFPLASCVADTEGSSIPRNRNRLAASGGGEWIVFLDPDTIVDAEYFDAMDRAIYGAGAKCGGIAGAINLGDCSMWGYFEGLLDILVLFEYLLDLDVHKNPFAALRLPKRMEGCGDVSAANSRINKFLRPYDGARIGTMQGFNCAIRRSVFEEVEGFDESLYSAEDRQVAFRILSHGYDLVFAPAAIVMHHYEMSFADIGRRRRMHGIGCGQNVSRIRPRGNGMSEWMRRLWKWQCDPPLPFSLSIAGRIHCAWAFLNYAVPVILQERCRFDLTWVLSRGWHYTYRRTG